jgi:hypothetical protein
MNLWERIKAYFGVYPKGTLPTYNKNGTVTLEVPRPPSRSVRSTYGVFDDSLRQLQQQQQQFQRPVSKNPALASGYAANPPSRPAMTSDRREDDSFLPLVGGMLLVNALNNPTAGAMGTYAADMASSPAPAPVEDRCPAPSSYTYESPAPSPSYESSYSSPSPSPSYDSGPSSSGGGDW